MSTPSDSTKENASLERGVFSATGQKHTTNITTEKAIATLRATLCLADGQRLHIADDDVFFVTTPFGQIFRFDDLAGLQAHADRSAR